MQRGAKEPEIPHQSSDSAGNITKSLSVSSPQVPLPPLNHTLPSVSCRKIGLCNMP